MISRFQAHLLIMLLTTPSAILLSVLPTGMLLQGLSLSLSLSHTHTHTENGDLISIFVTSLQTGRAIVPRFNKYI